jgi:hypothetical protein
MPMNLYLDMCCLKRPFDDQSAARVQLETLAVEMILELCRTGQHALMGSEALRFENDRNPNAQRREFAEKLLAICTSNISHSEQLEQSSQSWQARGIGLLDSLHLASAEIGGADVFCTCDDIVLKKATPGTATMRVLSILDLVKELVP